VQVSPVFLDKIFLAIEADPNAQLEVNLPEQTITIVATGEKESFDINGYKKHNMTNGFDDIDYLQAMKGEIKEFEAERIY
jgi:3-isopropylmalate/(R)-2-methylmalate dehydratase small subunit